MENVKKLIEAGAPIPVAITTALKQAGFPTIEEFATRNELKRSNVSNHINGNVRATAPTVNALIAVLGGTADEWLDLLWQAARPEKVNT